MSNCQVNSGITVALHTKAEALPAEWADMLPPGHFLEPDQLTIYEKIHLPDISFIYAVIYSGGTAVAVAYFQVLSIRAHHLNTMLLKPLQRIAWKTFTATVCPKLLVAGHLFRHDICSFFWLDHQAGLDVFRLYKAAIDKALKHAHASAVLVKDIDESLIPYFQNYAPEYLLLRNDISMEMPINENWHSLKDYEKDLKHKYAQRLRKVRQPWEKLQLHELNVEEATRYKDILFALYQQVTERQQVRLGLLSADFLPALKKKYNHVLRIWVIREDEHIVGFFSAWEHEQAFDMFYIGFDYSKNEEYQLYFNILFFAVEQAIASRKDKLILGRTALEAKARLGCRPHYLSTYLFIRNGMVRNVISRLQQNLSSSEGEWENRHPFKTGS